MFVQLLWVSTALAASSLRQPRNAEQPRSSSSFGPVWPLPRSIHIFPERLQLAPKRFQIVHGPGSSAGPHCSLLQDAFRR